MDEIPDDQRVRAEDLKGDDTPHILLDTYRPQGTEPLPQATPDIPAAVVAPVVEEPVAKTKRQRDPKGAMLNLVMGLLVLCFGGLVAFSGQRRITFVRLIAEIVVLTAATALLALGLVWYLPGLASGISLHDAITRAFLFFVSSVIFAYVGGLVVYRGWKYGGDPRFGALVLAFGFAFLGFRVATLGIAVEEFRIAQTRHVVAENGTEALTSLSNDLKKDGIETNAPVEAIVNFNNANLRDLGNDGLAGILPSTPIPSAGTPAAASTDPKITISPVEPYTK